ncbi:MAG: ubiquinol-cytochrome c reductase iron-sulfur subunit [Lacipirellulaceae bacterium]
MADKKKMSVAEMLAAARKSDGEGGSEAAAESPAAPEPAAEETAPAAAETSSAPPKKIAKPGSPDRPSVADMLAMARSGGKPAEAKPAKKAAPKAKPAAAKADKPAAKAAKSPAPERDTASILAAARKENKPGPMSKSEAATKAAAPAPTKAKPAIVAPPMPAKPDYAKPKAKKAKKAEAVDEERRTMLSVGFGALGVMAVAWGGALTAFMFPNVLRELPSKFKVGTPDGFPPGQVSTKYKAQYGVWVVNTEYRGKQQLFALKSVCTHLGCTPSWLEAEQKFKCPCHGSGFYKDGINFEGPAPRPLERCFIHVASDGQVEIDKNITYQEEMGQWNDPTCYVSV